MFKNLKTSNNLKILAGLADSDDSEFDSNNGSNKESKEELQ